MTKINFLCFTAKQKFSLAAVDNAKFYQLQSNLKPRHYAPLIFGFPILIYSIVSSEPVLAGSEFIALMIMMFDRQLSGLVEWLNGQIKIWQVITVISIATILLAQLINPVNAISSTTLAFWSQFGLPDFAVLSIKLAIISLNLLLMAVIFFAWRKGSEAFGEKRPVTNQTRNIPTSSSHQKGFQYDYQHSIDFTNATPKVSYNKRLRTTPEQN